MKWFLLIFPLIVTCYTLTFGRWVWKKGNRLGAVGVFLLAVFNLALAVYSLYFRQFY